ncbi:MAG: 3-hydroxyacyl-CoA dehydrogenase NAD-binding domain-containing protein [Pseudomonadales bacterium]|nr:3-hydroxyacyl-CoA dehydrogenase NAD-binding domain-containing protein [Pseudomonadales bacterium]
MKGTVHYEVKKFCAILTIDNPPVNPLSSGVRQGLFDLIERAQQDEQIGTIIITGAGNSFIAGADISEFSGKMEGAPLPAVLNRMESSTKPIIAAINGSALGGGLETALCCDYRICNQQALFGLPEVKLGLLPGAGGTQRLPRLIGAEAALDIMLSARHVKPSEALTLGIIDAVAEDDLMEAAFAFAEDLKNREYPLRKIRDLSEHQQQDKNKPGIFDAARRLAEKTARGQRAPGWIIECVEAAVNIDDFDKGIAKEAENFFKCFKSSQRKALIHVFFNERNAAKIPDIPKETPRRDIKKAAVIGAGTMGGGIAMCFANAGIEVTLLDADQEGLDKGLAKIQKNYELSLAKGKLKQSSYEQRLSLIKSSLDYQELADADVIIEAVFENLALKKKIFEQLDSVAKSGAILATNTSALNIDEIAQVTSRPEDVIGMHFFSPANVMPLLEVVRGAETAKGVIATAMSLGKKLKKVSVLAGNCPGFIGNRMLFKYMEQASQLLLEGALPQDIDGALQEFGMAMGPFAMHDLVGLDLGWRERKKSGQSRDIDKVADALCEAERFGQKNGRGFYRYDENSRQPIPDDIVTSTIEKVASELGIERRSISSDEIVQRCIYALINEGAKILEESIAIRSSDIDIIYIYGYGFPAYRGGPMFYGDKVGAKQLIEDFTALEEQTGQTWEAANLIKQLAEQDGSLTKWQRTSV